MLMQLTARSELRCGLRQKLKPPALTGCVFNALWLENTTPSWSISPLFVYFLTAGSIQVFLQTLSSSNDLSSCRPFSSISTFPSAFSPGLIKRGIWKPPTSDTTVGPLAARSYLSWREPWLQFRLKTWFDEGLFTSSAAEQLLEEK